MTFPVSALISVYKAEKFLHGCLEDLVAQTLYQAGQLEIIIIDSNSPEHEGDIVRRYQQRFSNIKYIRTPERETLYKAWNRGIAASTGEYITNANADDRHRSDALEVLLSHLKKTPDIDLVYGDVVRTFKANSTFREEAEGERFHYSDFFPPDVLLHYQFGCQPLWNRSLANSVGQFNTTMKAAGDWEFNFRFNLAGKKALHIPEVLGVFYENPDSVSIQDGQSALEQQALRNRYGSPETVLELYALSGWPCISREHKAFALYDFSKRCLEFRLPWVPEQIYSDPVLANTMFGAAQRILTEEEVQ